MLGLLVSSSFAPDLCSYQDLPSPLLVHLLKDLDAIKDPNERLAFTIAELTIEFPCQNEH